MSHNNVFLVGSKSLGMYGGYETFVYKLLQNHKSRNDIRYHVACKLNGKGSMNVKEIHGVSNIVRRGKNIKEFTFYNARCFMIKVPGIGASQSIFYDIMALSEICKYIKRNKIEKPVVYIMACRIGPVSGYFKRRIHRLGGKVYLNPDGHEWKRSKWNWLIRQYWKMSERQMVKNSDLVICDSVNIQSYIEEMYGKYKINTTYISYGADVKEDSVSCCDKDKFNTWLRQNDLDKDKYYLMVGRFVPENNYEIVLREYLKTHTDKKLVIITTENEKFMDHLQQILHYDEDNRIKFLDAIYDHELLTFVRENAFAYIHGHEVGGTNPSLLESLASTKMSLLLDVCFNREVGKDAGLYWNKEEGNLASLIDSLDEFTSEDIENYEKKSKDRIKEAYSWNHIANEYEKVFLKTGEV